MQWTGSRGGHRHARRFTPSCPMLFTCGRRKPITFHSSDWAREIAAQPGSEVLAFDTGHGVLTSQSAEFNRAVLSWLKRTERAA